ncbi:hypothetical protein [Paenibacillus vandeheii]
MCKDLAIWNLLYTEESIHIIDDGEAGEIAADFEQGYAQGGNSFSRKSIYEQMHLWVVRGLLTVIRERGMVRQTIPYVQRNLQLLKKFKHVLCGE